MAIILRRKTKKSLKKWFTAIDELTEHLRGLLGDDLVEIIASEYPELGYDGYNFIVVVRRDLSDEEKARVFYESEKICEKLEADFSIILTFTIVNSMEHEEFRKAFLAKYDPKWEMATKKLTHFLRRFLGDDLVEIIASEYPELGYDGYNFIVVVRRDLSDEEKARVFYESEKICEKLEADFSINILFEVKKNDASRESVDVL